MKWCAFLIFAVVACSERQPAEQYGFVALLGRDTVSVERISRTPTGMVTDGVDRFPFVRQRHSEFELDKDGRITKMRMDVRTPSGRTPAERSRQITADISGNDIHIVISDSSGVRDTTFATGGILVVPHVSMMYSVIELEVAWALRQATTLPDSLRDRVRFRQYYPDRDIGPNFAFHQGFVFPRGDGAVELRHDWLAGTGQITVDSAFRMLTYSGARTTYHVAVTRTTSLPDIETIGAAFAATETRAGAAQLSVRDTMRASIGTTTMMVDYSRPLARGRALLGNIIPYDNVWRTGANAATQFTTSSPIQLNGLSLPAGTYTLWTIPRTTGVELVINSQTGQWGTTYNKDLDIGRVPMTVETVADTVEKFTIAIAPGSATAGTLSLSWGTFRWTAPIQMR